MGGMIELKSPDDFGFSAYQAEPAGTPVGGLVMVQEIFGVIPTVDIITWKVPKSRAEGRSAFCRRR